MGGFLWWGGDGEEHSRGAGRAQEVVARQKRLRADRGWVRMAGVLNSSPQDNRESIGLGLTMVTAEAARRLLSLHGEVRAQPSSDWTGAFPIPPAVEKFCREVGPVNVTIEAYGNRCFLPCLAELWQFQAGYRWNGLSGEAIEDWNDDWLVVADQGGDPFIFARSSGAVLHAYHGQGDWDASEIFPDLNTMAACLAQVGAVVLEAGPGLHDKDYSIRPEFRALASARLEGLLGSKARVKTVLEVLGWD